MRFKLFILLISFFIIHHSFAENIALLKELNEKSKNAPFVSNNIEKVIESFDDKVIIIDYFNMVDWNQLENQSDFIKEKAIYKALNKFFKKNHINKLIIGGDSYHYNEPPFHPKPKARFYFTKVLTKMIKERKIRVLGICGGMQGILYFNDIELNSVKNILDSETDKYNKAWKYANPKNEQFFYDKKQFRSCNAPLNKIFIDQKSFLGKMMLKAEKKYRIKYQRHSDNFLIANTLSLHFHGVDNKLSNIIKLYDKDFRIVGLSEDDIIYIVEDKNHNILIQGHPELTANIIKCPDNFSKEDVIFSRLLFNNLLKKQKKIYSQ